MRNLTITDFSEKTASKEAVPGGGGVSASVGALSSALAQMVCNLTIGKPKYIMHTVELEDIKEEADIIRNNLLDCINSDAESFYPLSKAYAIDKNNPKRDEILEECLKQAASSPMLILKYCTRIIDLDSRLSEIGSKLSVSDAGTSVMLAYGAMHGAYINVLVNTKLMKDRNYASGLETEAKELIDEYSSLALKCYQKVIERLS